MVNLQEIKRGKTTKELLNFGILNIDKPVRKTSFEVSDFVRKKITEAEDIETKNKSRKTSHFGTLDPQVTGVLPVALGRAVKLTGFFIGEDKTYVGIARFHQETDIKTLQKKINEKFLGRVLQTPPVKSRVKRQSRPRTVYEFKILESDENRKDFLFYVKCQRGTYARKLISDLGAEVGISGHMLELRRIKAGPFSENQVKTKDKKSKINGCVDLYDFEKAITEYKESNGKNDKKLRDLIIPAEVVSELYPVLELKDKPERIKQFLTGKPIYLRDIKDREKVVHLKPDKIVSVFLGNRFIGMYQLVKSKENNEIFAKPEFVYN